MLNPSTLPGFSFSWVQIVSHRFFLPRLIQSERKMLWAVCKRLLVDFLEFLNPYLLRVPLSNTIRMFYKAALRIMLVLVHDFPEFLCDYHFDLVNVIPYSCVQLRNLILSAFPQDMKLPDPFTPNLKVDLLPEINQSPNILSNYTASLVQLHLLESLELYLDTRGPQSFLTSLSSKFIVESSSSSPKYDIKAINSLVLYTGMKAISNSKSKGNLPDGVSNAPLDIFQQLSNDMDSESKTCDLNFR
jgi:CCR4-NOT transcription complex subunit 1